MKHFTEITVKYLQILLFKRRNKEQYLWNANVTYFEYLFSTYTKHSYKYIYVCYVVSPTQQQNDFDDGYISCMRCGFIMP